MPGLYEKNINTHDTKLMRMDLQIDHELKNLIRPLTFDERNGLQDNLIQNGCHDSIKTWNGIIVDGHNRYEICNEQGIEYKIDELAFDSKDDVKVWMIRQQLDKRNVNDYTRTSLCLKMENILQKTAKVEHAIKHTKQHKESTKEQNSTPLLESKTVTTRDKIAKSANVSYDTVSKVKFIEENATDEQKNDLQKGTDDAGKKVSIHKVYTELKKQEVEPIIPAYPDSACETCDVSYPDLECEHCIYNGCENDLKEDAIDTDYCKIIPFTPIKSQVVLCPCGCGYGYCWTNNTWYTQEQINELNEE